MKILKKNIKGIEFYILNNYNLKVLPNYKIELKKVPLKYSCKEYNKKDFYNDLIKMCAEVKETKEKMIKQAMLNIIFYGDNKGGEYMEDKKYFGDTKTILGDNLNAYAIQIAKHIDGGYEIKWHVEVWDTQTNAWKLGAVLRKRPIERKD